MEDLTGVSAKPFDPARSFASRLAPLLAGALLTLCFLVLMAVYLWAIRRLWSHAQTTRRQNSIGKEAIEQKFPVQQMEIGTQTVGDPASPTCAVCLEPVAQAEPFRRLQCGHSFHADCIMDWWTHVPRTSLECPVCKRRQRVSAEDDTPVATGGGCRAEHRPVSRREARREARGVLRSMQAATVPAPGDVPSAPASAAEPPRPAAAAAAAADEQQSQGGVESV